MLPARHSPPSEAAVAPRTADSAADSACRPSWPASSFSTILGNQRILNINICLFVLKKKNTMVVKKNSSCKTTWLLEGRRGAQEEEEEGGRGARRRSSHKAFTMLTPTMLTCGLPGEHTSLETRGGKVD